MISRPSFLRVRDAATDFNLQNYQDTALKVYPLPSAPKYFYCVNADPAHPERGVDSDVVAGRNSTRSLVANVEYQTPLGKSTLSEWNILYPVSPNH